MADATGWQMLGAALGGTSEEEYQKGLAMGANTQKALADARARVDENTQKLAVADALEKAGLPPELAAASSTVMRAGGGLGDAIELILKNQTLGFNTRVADPNVPLDEAQRIKLAQASGPVEPLYKIGGGYANKFDSAAGITPLGDSLGGEGGGSAAGMQYARSLGLLDENDNVKPGMEQIFYDVIHPTGRVTDEAGVPGKIDFNPYRTPGATPRPPAPGPAAPGPVVPTAPAPAGAPGAGITPLSDAARVGANAAEIERSKVVGRGVGEAQLALPQAKARFMNQTAQTDLVMGNIDKVLPEISGWTTGPAGQLIGTLWGTPAYDVKSAIATIKANIGFQQLQQMRYESPTGGALGQVAVQELAFLQAALGNLDTAQSPTQVREMLGQVRQRYEQFKAAAAADYAAAETKAAMGGGTTPAPTPAAAQPSGEVKIINGKKYVKVGNEWFEDDGT